MKYKEKLAGTFCVVGKSVRNKLPHIISCSIGIESATLAIAYSKQFSKMKVDRKPLYEWTQPKTLNDALKDLRQKKILIAPTDHHYLEMEYKPLSLQ